MSFTVGPAQGPPDVEIVNPITTLPSTNGGMKAYRRLSTADTNAAVIKNSAGQLYGVALYNVGAAIRYVKLYNKATTPNPASDIPVKTFMLPATNGKVEITWGDGVEFNLGLGIVIVTGIADTDATPPLANEVIANIDYF